MTFDESATSFTCPCCGNFCNCTQCARGRGETYVPERNGGWRRWAASFPVAAAAAAAPSVSTSSRKEASQEVIDLTEPGQDGTTAQELETDDTTPIVPVEPVAMAPLPPRSTPNTLISSPHSHVHPIPTTSTATTKSVVDKKRCRHVYIGKRQKSWGRFVSVPDPDPALGRGSGRNGRKRKRAIRVRLFVGSEDPLLLSQKRTNKRARKNTKRGRGKPKKVEKNEQRQIASSLPATRSSSVDARGEGDAEDPDANPDADLDKGGWPGEYDHAYVHDKHITAVPPGVTVGGVGVVATTISPESLKRAIGAAFAAGM